MPMTKEQHLLTILGEECAEVQKLVAKILRFGLDSYHPEDETKTTNQALLYNEIIHVLTMAMMLNESGTIKESISIDVDDHSPIINKMFNVEKYLKVSESMGLLEA